MKRVRIINSSKQKIIVESAEVADTFFKRAKGLIGRETLETENALVITKCNSIHMFFMKFPIDVVFVDKSGKVLKIINNIQPGQVSPVIWKASYVIEFPAGFATSEVITKGDILRIE